MNVYNTIIKRCLDFIISFVALVVLSPVILVVAILVRIKMGSPIVFSQNRPGKNNKNIKVYKFRSMTNEVGADGFLLPDSARMTKFGSFLRATSLDELPQLFSILKGDMSFIGPRPQSYENFWFMTDEQKKRQLVLPGLTGLAQINGRNAITWDKKLDYDLEYIKNITFLGDVKIFIKTIGYVLKREDITFQGTVSNETVGQFLLRTGQITVFEYDEKFNEFRNSGL